jgi:hypothetical protein
MLLDELDFDFLEFGDGGELATLQDGLCALQIALGEKE